MTSIYIFIVVAAGIVVTIPFLKTWFELLLGLIEVFLSATITLNCVIEQNIVGIIAFAILTIIAILFTIIMGVTHINEEKMEEFKDKSKKKILELVDETGEEFKFFVKYKITVKDVAGNIETYFCDGRKFIQKVEGGYNALTDEEIKELLSKETDNSYEFNKEEIS